MCDLFLNCGLFQWSANCEPPLPNKSVLVEAGAHQRPKKYMFEYILHFVALCTGSLIWIVLEMHMIHIFALYRRCLLAPTIAARQTASSSESKTPDKPAQGRL